MYEVYNECQKAPEKEPTPWAFRLVTCSNGEVIQMDVVHAVTGDRIVMVWAVDAKGLSRYPIEHGMEDAGCDTSELAFDDEGCIALDE